MRLFEDDRFYALRLSSAIMGMGGLLSTFLLARRLFSDRVALVATFLMAVGFWHIHNSRTGFPFIQGSFCIPLVLYLLVRARQDRSYAMMALTGVVAGLCLQGYFTVRAILLVTPPIPVGGVDRATRFDSFDAGRIGNSRRRHVDRLGPFAEQRPDRQITRPPHRYLDVARSESEEPRARLRCRRASCRAVEQLAGDQSPVHPVGGCMHLETAHRMGCSTISPWSHWW